MQPVARGARRSARIRSMTAFSGGGPCTVSGRSRSRSSNVLSIPGSPSQWSACRCVMKTSVMSARPTERDAAGAACPRRSRRGSGRRPGARAARACRGAPRARMRTCLRRTARGPSRSARLLPGHCQPGILRADGVRPDRPPPPARQGPRRRALLRAARRRRPGAAPPACPARTSAASSARAFGESPHQYLLTRRLERAAALLRTTDRTVAESASRSACRASARSRRASRGCTASRRRRTARTFPPAAEQALVPACVVRAYGRPQHRTFREDSARRLRI